jgi:hypothetical protein
MKGGFCGGTGAAKLKTECQMILNFAGEVVWSSFDLRPKAVGPLFRVFYFSVSHLFFSGIFPPVM